MNDHGPDDHKDDKDGLVGGFPTPPIDECPVIPLGHYGNKVVFVMPEGQIREEKASDIGKLLKVDLFNRREGQLFLNYWRDAEDKFAREQCAVWFVRQCREAGFWDASRPRRGLGVWPGRAGSVVLHRGDELWTFTADEEPEIMTVAEAMRARTGPIYDLKSSAPAPDESSTVDDGKWVLEKLHHWNWEPIGDDGLTGADIVAGWTMVALLGAVAPFRPHLLLFAMFGGGKSTLIEFVHGMLSSLAGEVIDRFTPAGLMNDLGGMARPVMIDEAEASPATNGPGPVEQALELLRRMATGSGGKRKMGTIGGGSITQTAVGAVMMGAINPVKLTSQDASRIAEIKLRPLTRERDPGEPAWFKPASNAEIERSIRAAVMLSPHLLGRALRGAPRYLADVAMIKAALLRQGQSQRAADLVAALAAGRRLLTSDDALDERQADEVAGEWRGLVTAREQSEIVSNPGSDCLAHLLAWPSGKHEYDRIVSLGELVSLWARSEALQTDTDPVVGVLKEFGIKPVMERDADGHIRPWLQVAHNAPILTRVFERTVWRDWRRSLAYLDEMGPEHRTRTTEQPVRFGVGVRSRATCVPLDPWIEVVNARAVPASVPGRAASRAGQAHE